MLKLLLVLALVHAVEGLSTVPFVVPFKVDHDGDGDLDLLCSGLFNVARLRISFTF